MYAALLALLPVLASANPVKRWQAASDVGSTTTDAYPPTSTRVNKALFPGESAVGYPGVTLTGIEPLAIQTAAAYPVYSNQVASWPLVTDEPEGSDDASFDITKYWGNLSPVYSVPSSAYGLDTTGQVPDSCSVTQVHLLYRHGARYPTSGAAPSAFAARLAANVAAGDFVSWGELEFLNQWTYKLGAELLTPFGRLQNFELGVEMRYQYGHLLNNFTAAGTLPVFRTESQDRMANNFAAGFFGVPEYLDEVKIEIMIETPGKNNTGAPYETCANSNVASRGSIGTTAATAFANNAFNATMARLQSQITGYNLTSTDMVAMLQLCSSYETNGLGYSAFCGLFTEDDFENYEYYYDISFYYNNGAGSPVAAAQGKGFLQEFLARATHTQPVADSTINSTLDSSATYFPLNQSIYADATHEVVVLDTLTAFNLSALFSTGPLSPTKREPSSLVASQVVPFGTKFLIQVLECSDTTPSKQARFLVNDAVLPLDGTYEGCAYSADGRCAFDTVVAALQKRNAEIDFDYDCFGNYTAVPGMDYNGRAPRA